jgi:exopolysaccharide biosynthesis WecB/TagA/CpsF family protein
VLKRLDHIPCRAILDVDVAVLKREQAITLLLERFSTRRQTAVTFANTNLLTLSHRDPQLRGTLADMLVLNDGIGVDAASWVLHGATFPDNLNGTDFTPALLAALPVGTRVFLYGARSEVVARAAGLLADMYPIDICGAVDGYARDAGAVADEAARSQADVVLVALGNPLQERWIATHADRTGATLLLGVGAYFDFVSGRATRAPAWVRSLRFEWMYRLMREPKRLWRRYTVDVVTYFAAVGAMLFKRSRTTA